MIRRTHKALSLVGRIKRQIIHFADFTICCRVLRHRWLWFCVWVSHSDWWGEGECPCGKCAMSRRSWTEIT
jgi:hypothetical protein